MKYVDVDIQWGMIEKCVARHEFMTLIIPEPLFRVGLIIKDCGVNIFM